jgi:hypothetical protein
VLFAGFCVLALMAYNIREIALSDMWATLLLALLISVIVYGLTRLLIRDWHRAALMAFAVLFSFFTYGQIYNLLKNASIGNVYFFRHRTLLLLYGLLLILASIGSSAGRKARKLDVLAQLLNLLVDLSGFVIS